MDQTPNSGASPTPNSPGNHPLPEVIEMVLLGAPPEAQALLRCYINLLIEAGEQMRKERNSMVTLITTAMTDVSAGLKEIFPKAAQSHAAQQAAADLMERLTKKGAP